MKRVFLIGDSIRIGYCEHVAALLEGRAEVLWPNENCRFAHYVMATLGIWAGAIPEHETVDVVHWNCGHWDMAQFDGTDGALISTEDYAKALRRVDAMIRRIFPKAQIVFALTTPVLPGVPMSAPRTMEDVVRYNETALEVMKELNVPVNDLFAVARTLPDEAYTDAVHFTPEGSRVLAEAVVRAVEKYI